MTHAEMNEAVALRLGWKYDTLTYCRVSCNEYHAHGEDCVEPCSKNADGAQEKHRFWRLGKKRRETLPFWSTDDGLAFEELWPRIGPLNGRGLAFWNGKPAIIKIWCGQDDTTYRTALDFKADTWAEAICKAFIALVPLEEAK